MPRTTIGVAAVAALGIVVAVASSAAGRASSSASDSSDSAVAHGAAAACGGGADSASPTCVVSHDDDPRSGYVSIHDGVLSSAAALGAVGDLCVAHEKRHEDGSSYFVRPSPPGIVLTPLEKVMDSILDAFNDTSPFVEYWSREEYLNVDAHCDIDEGALEDRNELRGPDMGHVLYLSVGEDVVAPTIVFTDRRIGWDRTGTSPDSERNDADKVGMVSVPAVDGRLLRFDGRMMHAVPRPADRYLLSERQDFFMRDRLADDDDDYTFPYDDDEFADDDEDNFDLDGDDGDVHWYDWKRRALDIEDNQYRHVLLFNTWSGGPPRGVDLDSDSNDGSDGDGDDDDANQNDSEDDEDEKTATIEDLYHRWSGEFGSALERLACEDPAAWTDANVAPPLPAVANLAPPGGDGGSGSDDDVPLRIKLMGNEERRLHPTLHATAYVSRPDGEALAAAVRRGGEEPWRFVLRPAAATTAAEAEAASAA